MPDPILPGGGLVNGVPVLILVTGHHRSGTSATAGSLQALGVELGDKLMPPARDNPKGFFEDLGNPRLGMSGHFDYMPVYGPDEAGMGVCAEVAYAELLKSGVTTLVDLSVPYPGWLELLAASLQSHQLEVNRVGIVGVDPRIVDLELERVFLDVVEEGLALLCFLFKEP